jgi:hypothetical protein
MGLFDPKELAMKMSKEGVVWYSRNITAVKPYSHSAMKEYFASCYCLALKIREVMNRHSDTANGNSRMTIL